MIHGATQLQQVLETLDQERHFIQEFIPGPMSSMRSVAVLYDDGSRLRAYFTNHKLRQWPLDGGICALGRSTYEPELLEFVQLFFDRWQWQGVAEVEIKIDARDGAPKLIEINPVFGAVVILWCKPVLIFWPCCANWRWVRRWSSHPLKSPST